MAVDELLALPPYGLGGAEKDELLLKELIRLSTHHYERCQPYRRICDGLGLDLRRISSHYEIPFLPVSLFKELELRSVDSAEIVKTITSSGTSGQAVSRIFLDKNTASGQQKALAKIVGNFIGGRRLPMLIIDSPSVLKNRQAFSARGAGILGFSIFSSDRAYALTDDMELNFEAVTEFLSKHQGRNILLFGFTFMIWQHFYKTLLRSGQRPDLSKGILIHGGGWKKLISEAVSPAEFAESLKRVCGLEKVHDYYGMAEQTGSIHMQCEEGNLHASVFSDVIVRDPADFSVCSDGRAGIIQVISLIAESYPGHSLLTEDEGLIMGRDGCPCGRRGTYFKVLGRLKNAELRGCSDTYAVNF